MNLIENLIQIAGEEAAEIAQALSKVNRFGPESVNPTTKRSALQDVVWELNDLHAVIELLKDRGLVLEGVGDPVAIGAAKKKIIEELEVSQKAGLLQLPETDGATPPQAPPSEPQEPENNEEEEEEQEEEEEEAGGGEGGEGGGENEEEEEEEQ